MAEPDLVAILEALVEQRLRARRDLEADGATPALVSRVATLEREPVLVVARFASCRIDEATAARELAMMLPS